MQITTELIKELRDATGVSVMQCKKALEEAEGNMEKALMILKKKSSDIALKKADRATNDGLVVMKAGAGKTAVIILGCETDFVAKNSDFITLAENLANLALTEGKDAAMEKSKDMISPIIQKIGENIQLGTVDVIEGEVLGSYVHTGKSGAIVALKGGDEALAKDIAMHVAAMKPEYATISEVPADMKEKVKGLFEKEVAESGKPADIQAKILA